MAPGGQSLNDTRGLGVTLVLKLLVSPDPPDHQQRCSSSVHNPEEALEFIVSGQKISYIRVHWKRVLLRCIYNIDMV